MEQIVIQTRNKEKARLLVELLAAMDFIESVETNSDEGAVIAPEVRPEEADFFALAGIWEGRDISLESIRQEAWPPQKI
jgi:hypothetical protein